MGGIYYPAVVLGDFSTARQAIASVATSEAQAAMLLQTWNASPGSHVTVYAEMEYSNQVDSLAEVISIERIAPGQLRLCFGWPGFRFGSRRKAAALAQKILASDPFESLAKRSLQVVALRWRGITPVNSISS
ncbi:hypothetical protein EDD84_18710 [Burkholderia gladioli]|nr:hypothetical protein [Burkholderia gladioli]AYQ89187.1 hypothetical protein EDD84_18710 [Burkholderia gladioli]